MVKTQKGLLPVKAHYFFFFAALGPLLPQLNVFGRQLGVSPDVMGMVTAVLPILWALAKPLFGFLVDYFQKQRKLIFIGLILLMSGSYCFLYFLPNPPASTLSHIVDFNSDEIKQRAQPWINIRPLSHLCEDECPDDLELTSISCGWTCGGGIKSIRESNQSHAMMLPQWELYIKQLDNITLTDLYYNMEYNVTGCDYFYMDIYETVLDGENNKTIPLYKCMFKENCPTFSCALLRNINLSDVVNKTQGSMEEYFLYGTVTFWGFVSLMCVGTVAFNVANCISDAICFDVLGADRSMKYGYQRAWGTIGYGVTALLAGWAVDWASGDSIIKDFTPAFVLTTLFTLVDLYFCRKLKLPKMSRPEGAGNTLSLLLSRPSVLVFLFFAVVAGIFDSFIIYYMFWFLEELATQTGHMGNIKLLEGLTVAAESFGGELLFFLVSGKILKRFGFGVTLTFCLACYGLRFILISLITNPWQILAIELIMQGPTYALTYSTIVGYAAAVAPPGLSATLQGIVAGMDDGLGFAIGSLLGGQLYKYLGGRAAFQFFSVVAFVAAIGHAILVATIFKNYIHESTEENVKDGPIEPSSAEHDNLLDRALNGKIVTFTALEKDEEKVKENGSTLIISPPYNKV